VGGGGGDVHGDDAALLGAQGFDANVQAVDGPLDLDPRIDQRLAALAGRGDGQVLRLVAHDRGGAAEDGDALGDAEPGVAVLVQGRRRRQRLLDGCRSGDGDVADHRPVIGRGDRQCRRCRVRRPPIAGHCAAAGALASG
jgi:hypothetical protein